MSPLSKFVFSSAYSSRKEYPVLTEGKEVRRICDDENGVLTIMREMGEKSATISFDMKN